MRKITALRVHLNGKHACDAGIGGRGSLSAIVNVLPRTAALRQPKRKGASRARESLDIRVGGFTYDPDGAGVFVDWIQEPVKIGDRIQIEIVRVQRADEPRSRRRDEPSIVEDRKRAYYERLKREYGE